MHEMSDATFASDFLINSPAQVECSTLKLSEDPFTFHKTFDNLIREEKKLEIRKLKRTQQKQKQRQQQRYRQGHQTKDDIGRRNSNPVSDRRREVEKDNYSEYCGSTTSICSSFGSTSSQSAYSTLITPGSRSKAKIKNVKFEKEEKLFKQYCNKLVFYIIDEINSANRTKRKHDALSHSFSEIGLSIDYEKPHQAGLADHDSADYKKTKQVVSSLYAQVNTLVPDDICRQLNFRHDVHFYQVISLHFGSPSFVNFIETSFLAKCENLYLVESFPKLFAMMLVRYILKFDHPSKQGYERRFQVFLKGCKQSMFHDIKHGQKKGYSLFSYIRSKLRQKQKQKLQRKKKGGKEENRAKLKDLLCRFYFYYCSSKPVFVIKFLRELDVSLDHFLNICLSVASLDEKVENKSSRDNVKDMEDKVEVEAEAASRLKLKLLFINGLTKLLLHSRNGQSGRQKGASATLLGKLQPDTLVKLKQVLEKSSVQKSSSSNPRNSAVLEGVRETATKSLKALFPAPDTSVLGSLLSLGFRGKSKRQVSVVQNYSLVSFATDMMISLTPLRFFISR